MASRRGLSLLEIMVTITIIGMLATLAFPAITQATRTAQVMRTATDLRHYVSAITQFNLANGYYPADRTPGQMPPNMQEMMPHQFTLETPLGGQWDWDQGQFGTRAAISIYNQRPTVNQIYTWFRLDVTMDDGNLGSGMIRLRPSGLMYVIEEES